MEPVETIKAAMEDYWRETSKVAQMVANIISFERQSVTDLQMETLVEANAGLRAANNVLVEIRRQSDTPLMTRVEKMLDDALCRGSSHVETLRLYSNVVKTLEGK